MPIDDLKARLAALKTTSAALSDDDAAEATVRDEIAAEEDRIESERAKKRALDNARILDAAKRKAGPDAILELKDLDDAGVYVMTSPPSHAAEKFREAAQDKGMGAKQLDDLALSAMVYPDPDASGVETRAVFDRFSFASQTLVNSALRLGGLKIEARRKK